MDKLAHLPLSGAKLALFCDGEILTMQRDDRPDIPWPGLWDLPGGGAEPGEDAPTCALRELHEELGLILPPARLIWQARLPALRQPGHVGVIFGGHITRPEVAQIRLGGEGQGWAMMPVAAFLAHPCAIPALQTRAAMAARALLVIR